MPLEISWFPLPSNFQTNFTDLHSPQKEKSISPPLECLTSEPTTLQQQQLASFLFPIFQNHQKPAAAHTAGVSLPSLPIAYYLIHFSSSFSSSFFRVTGFNRHLAAKLHLPPPPPPPYFLFPFSPPLLVSPRGNSKEIGSQQKQCQDFGRKFPTFEFDRKPPLPPANRKYRNRKEWDLDKVTEPQ